MAPSPKTKPSSISVAFWNADGLPLKRHELTEFMSYHNLDIVLVNETHLKPCQNPKIRNYDFYRVDRPGNGGGTGIYIRNSIDHYEADTPTNLSSLEANSIVVCTTNGEIRFTSVYRSPKYTNKLDPDDIDALLGYSQPTIIAGDLNAKHPTWNSRNTNLAGRTLRAHLDKIGVAAHGPVDPTHYPRTKGNPDVIDICLVKDVGASIEVFTANDLSSDHNPVLMFFNGEHEEDEAKNKFIRWEQFSEELDALVQLNTKLDSTDDVDAAVERFTTAVHTAMTAATVTKSKPRATHRLPQEIEDLIKMRRRARRQWQTHRDILAKREMNRTSRQLRIALTKLHNDRWEKLLDSLNPEDNSLWRISKSLKNKKQKIPPIHGQNGLAYRDSEKAEAFAQSLEDQFSPNYDHLDEDHVTMVSRTVRQYINTQQPDDNLVEFATPAEIADILQHAKVKKASGPDRIPNMALRHFGKKAVLAMCEIINAAMRLCHFPAEWKKADVVVIPKEGKNRTFPQNYRPISLLSNLAKVFEKIILKRLQTAVDAIDAIPDEQHGFRQGHSTCHQLLRVVEHITYGFNWKLSTGALLLDVSKAFDRVWHKGLIFKMIVLNLPANLILLINSYLQGRTFKVKLGSIFSKEYQIRSGVPQGSLLGPLLYIIFGYDMPKPPGTLLAQYADDTGILVSAKQPHAVRFKLQKAADKLEEWFSKWRVAINGTKSTALFCSRTQRYHGEPIKMFGEEVPWAETAKYLGVVLDRRLNWTRHFEHIKKRITAAKANLYPLLNRRSVLSPKNKLRLYTSTLRPILTYAAPVWAYGLNNTTKQRMQAVQNICLRQAVDAPSYVRNTTLHQDLHIPYVHDYVTKLAADFLEKAATHPNASVRTALAYQPEEAVRHPRPKCILKTQC